MNRWHPSALRQALRERMSEITQDLPRLAITMLLGFAGGAAFAYFRMPLPWVVGSMCATIIAALLGGPIRMPNWFRGPMYPIIGIMLAGGIDFGLLGRIGDWIGSAVGIMLFIVLIIPIITIYLNRVAGFDTVTSYFSAAPGGLIPMSLQGGALGGDEKVIALLQGTRLVLTVLTIPLAYRIFAGYEPSANAGLGGSFNDLTLAETGYLLAAAFAGIYLGRLFRIPAASMMGPFILVALLRSWGVVDATIPDSIAAFAQIVVGAGLGAQFLGFRLKTIAKISAHGVVAGAAMIVFALIFSVVISRQSGQPFNLVLLGYAPGGVVEMSLISMALGLDLAFVMSHQLLRYIFIVLFAPIAFSAIDRYFPGRANGILK